MTKNELINKIHSLKIDLKYLKRELQFRLENNDLDATIEAHKDDEHRYAALSGALQAKVMLDNQTFERSIKTITNIEKDLEV